MRAFRSFNFTTTPQLFFPADKQRGIFILRNTDAAIIIRCQFGSPSNALDGFDVLAGDTLTLDRGDLTQEIYIWAATATSNNNLMVG